VTGRSRPVVDDETIAELIDGAMALDDEVEGAGRWARLARPGHARQLFEVSDAIGDAEPDGRADHLPGSRKRACNR